VAPLWVAGTGAGLGIAQTLTVYGRVASGQTNLAVGNYQETTITVTVTY
jgi:spore coat protein U-like protein